MYLLHHQVYDPADVIWDAEDWADANANEWPDICTDCHSAPAETLGLCYKCACAEEY